MKAPLGTFVHARVRRQGRQCQPRSSWVSRMFDGSAASNDFDRLSPGCSRLVTARLRARACCRAALLEVEVFALPNLGGVNVVIHGLLGQGVAASTRFDPQAKGARRVGTVATRGDAPEALP